VNHRLLSVVLVTSALALGAAVGEPAVAAEDGSASVVYGSGVGDVKLVPIARILAHPDKFEGREVAVRGKVTGVCPMKGCWMELEEKGARVRIKVEDDVIVFPVDAEGDTAIARGKVELLDMERDAYVAWRRHLAEELGQTFDESSIGDGPYRIVQIAGLGAEIER
jgi:hypothetical protein